MFATCLWLWYKYGQLLIVSVQPNKCCQVMHSHSQFLLNAGVCIAVQVGMHFMNPVPVMRLVELIRGMQTSDEVMCFFMGPLPYQTP